jgi:hypothetical protein
MKAVQKMQEKFLFPRRSGFEWIEQICPFYRVIDGDISITDFTGVVEVSIVNGDIIAENISGEAVASTVNGDITCIIQMVNKESVYISAQLMAT